MIGSLLIQRLMLIAIIGITFMTIGSAFPESPTPATPVNSTKEAVERAFSFVGIEALLELDSSKAEASTNLIRVVDSTTPFLSNDLNGRTAWQISLPGAVLRFDSTDALYLRDITLSIDSSSGQLLSMELWSDGTMRKESFEPLAGSAERQMSRFGEEYTAVPSAPPHLNFMTALNVVFDGNPWIRGAYCKVRYVMYRRGGLEPVPAWVVHVFGIANFRNITNMRWVIDATTGQQLHAVNAPHRFKE